MRGRDAAAIALLLGLGGCDRRCNEGSILLAVSYRGGARGADRIEIDVTIDGRPAESTKAVRPDPSRADDIVEIRFQSGYPTGKAATLGVVALRGEDVVGKGRRSTVLDGACTVLSLEVTGALGDLSMAEEIVDASVDGAPVLDAVATDGLSVDLSAWDLSEADTIATRPNTMFVTSTTYVPGSLGGLVGADQKCAARAATAGLQGTFVAWLSTATVNAADRLRQAGARGWIRPDGKPFADSIDLLTGAGVVFYPPRIDENGNDVLVSSTTPLVAVGTGPNGTVYTGYTCSDWTSTTVRFGRGTATFGSNWWSGGGEADCTQPAHLYCFGVDSYRPLDAGFPPGRIAFVTKNSFDPSTGRAGADALCAQEALSGGLSGTFLALLATMTESASQRIQSSGLTWIRPDGIPLVAQPAKLFDPAIPLDVSFHVAADGSRVEGYGVWFGARDVSLVGSANETCNDWTSKASTDHGQVAGLYVDTAQPFGTAPVNASCSSQGTINRLYCLQQ